MMKHLFVIILGCLVATLSCSKGEKIETIGSHTVTTAEFEEYYRSNLSRTSRFFNIEKAELERKICQPAEEGSRAAEVIRSLAPEEAYNKYREAQIVQEVARKENFDSDADIKKIIQMVQMETLAHLYVNSKIMERMQVSAEKKKEKCDELRKAQPNRYGPLPLEQCLELAELQIKSQMMELEYPRIVSEIKESVAIERHMDTKKKEEYLRNLPDYRKIMDACPK
ncbi:MAG: hypothetical protein HS115_03815 [Spirochaetales bacterium]|nr:hypothetical protein [Spirochaetales bacterium]